MLSFNKRSAVSCSNCCATYVSKHNSYSLSLTMVMVDCPVLIRLFRAPAECYSAFVEIVSSECESADDTDA